VIRLFGTKQDLFLDVYDRAAAGVYGTLAAAVRDAPFDGSLGADRHGLGGIHADLLRDRELELVLLHGFAVGDNVVIRRASSRMPGPCPPAGAPGRNVGWAGSGFIGQDMLLAVLLALTAPEDAPAIEDLRHLMEHVVSEETFGIEEAWSGPRGSYLDTHHRHDEARGARPEQPGRPPHLHMDRRALHISCQHPPAPARPR